ncbi:3-hydroxyacyl-CoA dehydrogenase family protein [Ornithinimicrobium sediminis]|uniref:3-hydroxyacyl-CoA dehydrogenase family protein n=1 Tax=Ornithinimicrobium sediminis TaxID=2904603 RepID=UPI001E53452B|nr:3-hydroxybutyryl-CoA dehydrogenase [Ornithinimicrobium sediminis]MCE0485562.1 3-hydroxyacyl-CoA dehydrogenase NAD-binding domain-containing protein [Ornithinimicrobium sediminis]
MASDISTVGVIGLGTMGAGIVEVFARGGRTVIGVETTEEFAERGRAILAGSTDRAVAKGRLDEAGRQEILDRVTITTDMAALAPADLVVEAVPETIDLKRDVFGRLDGIVREDAVLASNTSSLSITQVAAATALPGRVVGMHFFNPAPVLRLVEVVTTLSTEPEVTEAVVALAREMGKSPVVVGDRAGFVANYLLFGYLNSAMRMLEHGHVSREDLDTAMRVGAGLPMGPLTLMDLIGLDVCDHIGDVIYGHSRSPLHAPSAMLQQMVTAGRLGRKSGQGFYSYAQPGGGQVVPDRSTPAEVRPPAVDSVAVLGDGALAQELDSRLTEAGYAVIRLADVSDLSPVAGVDLVVEAQAEPDDGDGAELPGRDVDELFSELGQVTRPGTILATANTYSAVALAALSGRPEETAVLRMHAPTGNGQVVEIGRTGVTARSVVDTLRGVVTALGAEPVVCRDRTGLVVDALLVPHLNDAVRMLDQGYASVDDIDTATRFGLGYPMGPFAMIDHIGADEVLSVCEDMLTGSDGFQPHLAPSPLLVEHALLDRPFTQG